MVLADEEEGRKRARKAGEREKVTDDQMMRRMRMRMMMKTMLVRMRMRTVK